MIERMVALVAWTTMLIAGCDDLRSRSVHPVFADGNCTYGDATYSHGATACQSGTRYRCDEGQWKGWGTICTEDPLASDVPCELNAHAYSPGSASCQAGTRYRCDDGAWRTLGVACTGSDDGSAPISVENRSGEPEGRRS